MRSLGFGVFVILRQGYDDMGDIHYCYHHRKGVFTSYLRGLRYQNIQASLYQKEIR